MRQDFLFVYGWLKRKYHKQLPFAMPSVYIGEAYTFGQLYKVAEYPGILLKGSNKVFGEIYELPANYDWSKMDAFEHASPLFNDNPDYRRVKARCFIGHKALVCWVYEYIQQVNAIDLIESGDF